MTLNLKISHRFAIGYALVLALMVGVAIMAEVHVSSIASNLQTINDVNAVKETYAVNLRDTVHERAISTRDVTMISDPADLAATISRSMALRDVPGQCGAARRDHSARDRRDA